MIDSDMVFNSSQPLTSSKALACPYEGVPQILYFDVETVALHEFGHMTALGHTSDGGAVMYPWIDDCQTRLASHDVRSMNYVYENH